MDFQLTDEQKQLSEELGRFASERLNDDLLTRDHSGTFSQEAWARCAEQGIQGLPIPTEFGGSQADATTIAIALEALGFGCRDNGLLFSLGAQMWSCELPLVRFGSDEQKRRFLPALSDGTLIGVQTVTESEAGSDALGMSATATKTSGGWLINGSKTFITNAPIAGVFIVFARTDKDAGAFGISAFVLERETPGLSVGEPMEKMGLRTSPLGEVFFNGCEVGDDALLGAPGAGLSIFHTAMDWERTFILAPAIGTMQRLLDRAIEHAKSRTQSGSPIGAFQSVANRIVDMKVRLESARLLLYRAAWMKDQGRSGGMESAIAKLHVSECFVASSLDALQTFGGYGYLKEYELERDVRDALASRIYSGTSDIQRNLIATYLGL